ncbi:MAG: helix-turn-helix domain protein [Devosia sp.]|nr:helix-turn-helix domain protein [Devosia sp.]
MAKPNDVKDAVSALELAAAKTTHYLKGTVSGGGALSEKPSVSREIRSLDQLGDFVMTRRKAKKLTQQEFADLAGVGRRFVSELESGKPTAEIGKVLKVLNALGIDLIVKDR